MPTTGGDDASGTDTEPATPQETATDESPSQDRPAPVPRSRVRATLRAAAAVLVCALIAGCAYFGYQFFQSARELDARDTAMTTGRQYALDLTSYDYRTFDETITKVTANSTEKFADEYTKVGEVLRDAVTQAKASAAASIVQAGVVEADEDSAVLLYFIDQSVTNTATPEPRVDRNRLQIGLVRGDDGWLLDDVQLL
ncbi:hypothetical protein NY08_2202 [Rhodococcus sp. B7740]|uniref:hypothetical protein n=1 Tax=Rhodococcus sp. B7740 TaxID=1564114 RepID=UPI0005D78FCD|nr:hypothetical protein [Rhodococcus sp. B7740]AJW40230.1 hypothetical protein NY08_2202 [Rhodococcus sp. B7740]